MRTRRCEHCPTRLGARHAHNARFCSGRCRKAANRAKHRASQLPAELTSRDRWVRHTARKVPLTVTGKPASSMDPATWSTYQAAKASTVGVGLGYVLAEGDGLVCIDLDHALDEHGYALPWAARVLELVPMTFIEISRSGRGLHIFGLAPAARGRKIRRGEVAVEVYSRGRYIAMTGNRYADAPAHLADLSGVIDQLEGGP
ncbi:bifunctional DNA primase/polymerase [Streptomyces sp. NPDC005279]|uniref:bifunctional DNA primase/polymerase n=1 Tax=Streptomyces sp. NPDC005279 TaxID=3364712 RepID=UPI0036ADCDA4